MLKAKIIMFSRSLTKDYRWIYSANFLNEVSRNCILNDFKEFENNKSVFLEERHLIVRRFSEGIVVYKFWETKDKDQNSRKIYALIGCMFSGFDLELAQIFYKYIMMYLYNNFDILFAKYQRNISEKADEIMENIDFSLDTIIEYYRTNKMLLKNNLLKFANEPTVKDCIIKNGMASLIPDESNNLASREKNNVSSILQNKNILSVKQQSKLIETTIEKENEYKGRHVPPQNMDVRKKNSMIGDDMRKANEYTGCDERSQGTDTVKKSNVMGDRYSEEMRLDLENEKILSRQFQSGTVCDDIEEFHDVGATNKWTNDLNMPQRTEADRVIDKKQKRNWNFLNFKLHK